MKKIYIFLLSFMLSGFILQAQCPDVLYVLINKATRDSIYFRCVASAPSFNIEYRKVGDVNWLTPAVPTQSQYASIGGLAPFTQYEVRVQSVCTSGTSAWKQFNIGRTMQIPAQLPFLEGFEDPSTIQWEVINTAQPNKWYIGQAVHAGDTGSVSAYISNDDGASNTYTTSALNVTHLYRDIEFSEQGLEYALSFDWRAYGERSLMGSNLDYLRVNLVNLSVSLMEGVVQTAGILESALNLSYEWQRKTIILPDSLYGQTKRLLFSWSNNQNNLGNQPPAAIDNIEVVALHCKTPKNLSIVSTTPTTISIKWDSLGTSGTLFDIEYREEGSSDMDWYSGINNDTNYIIGGSIPLRSNTGYKIRVRNNCGTNKSAWLYLISKTTQGAENLPFRDDFEGSSEWVFVNDNQYNKWHIGTAQNTNRTEGGNYGMYISNDNGDSNRYTHGTSHSFATKAIIIADTSFDYQIDYDWKCLGEQGTDYLRVWLAPVNDVITSGVVPNTSNWIALDGSTDLCMQSSWQHVTSVFKAPQPGIYKLIFYWRNNAFNDLQPPAAVDNISVDFVNCLPPSAMEINNINAATADIRFTTSYNVQGVRFYYKPLASGIWDSTEVSVPEYTEDASFTLQGLQAATIYELYAKANCMGSGHSMRTSTYTFQTSCLPDSAPWLETFDASGSTFPPNFCWESKSLLFTPTATMNASDMDSGANGWLQGIVDGNKVAYMTLGGNVKKHWLIAPVVDLGTSGNYFLEFDVKLSSSSNGLNPPVRETDDKFIVLFSYDDGQTWSPSNAFKWTNDVSANYPYDNLTEDFQTINIPLTYLTGNIRIAFYAESTTTTVHDYLFIDNIFISNCLKPSNLEIANITPTSADFSWTHPSEMNFVFEYKIDTASTWTQEPISGTSYSLSTLTPDTKYAFRVRTDCGEEVSSLYTSAQYFTTPCVAASIPITENFDNMAPGSNSQPNAPACWFFAKENPDARTYVYNVNSFSTPNCYLLNNSSSLSTQKTALISPYFSEPINSLRVRFMARGTSGYMLNVGYMTDIADISTFRLQDSVILTSIWTEYIVSFGSVASNANYIVFMHGQRALNQPICLDDISIEHIPSCGSVTGARITDVTSTRATLNWTGIPYASGYEIQYKKLADSVWENSIEALYSPVTIYGLQNSASYQVRIRSKCNVNDTGIWSAPVFLTTDCGVTTLPFEENFGSGIFPPACWVQKEGLLPANGTPVSFIQGLSRWNAKEFANITRASKAARLAIYGQYIKNWLITPPINLGDTPDAMLEFDLALVKFNSGTSSTPISPLSHSDTYDDKFMILVSSDTNWRITDTIAVWDNTESSRKYDSIAHTANGERIRIPLNGLTGVVRIAFYGESATGNAGTSENDLFLDNIRVTGTGTPPFCDTVTDIQIASTGAATIVKWTPISGQTQWEIVCKQGSTMISSNVITDEAVDTLRNLTRGSAYTISIRAICQEGDTSKAVSSEPFTVPLCPAVTNISTGRICATSAVINWSAPTPQQTKWQLLYTPEGGEIKSKIIDNATTDSLIDLTPNTAYTLQIRSICGNGDTSNYSSIHRFTTLPCQSVEGLTVSRIEDSLLVRWVVNPCQNAWQIVAVPANAPIGTGDTIETRVNEKKVKTPSSAASFDVYVRSKCGDGIYSEWSKYSSLNVSVLDNATNIKVTLSPNPANQYVNLKIEGATGEVELQLTTITGNVLRKEKFTCQYGFSRNIALHDLAKGTYLIHLKHKNWTKTEKLIVY